LHAIEILNLAKVHTCSTDVWGPEVRRIERLRGPDLKLKNVALLGFLSANQLDRSSYHRVGHRHETALLEKAAWVRSIMGT
jgi:hypothetical protein